MAACHSRAVALTIVVGALLLVSTIAFAQTPPPKAADGVPTTKQWNQTIGDWIVACSQDAEQRKTCALTQTLSNARTKQTVAIWSIGKGECDKVNVTLRGPLGVALAAGAHITVDAEKPFSVPYRTCISIGCVTIFEVTAPLLGQLRKASKVNVTFQGIRGSPLVVDFQMRGFPKAYDVYLQETAAK